MTRQEGRQQAEQQQERRHLVDRLDARMVGDLAQRRGAEAQTRGLEKGAAGCSHAGCLDHCSRVRGHGSVPREGFVEIQQHVGDERPRPQFAGIRRLGRLRLTMGDQFLGGLRVGGIADPVRGERFHHHRRLLRLGATGEHGPHEPLDSRGIVALGFAAAFYGMSQESLVGKIVAFFAEDESAGLADLGKPAGYLPRQLSRWIKQWELTKKIDYPNADLLIDWLQRTVTTVPEQTKASIVHGDYRLDNAIIDPITIEIKAVLDWEMSTLGDPLLDVALTLLYMTESNDNLRNTIPIALEVTSSPGYYTRAEFLAAYCAITDADTSYLDFCLALSCFKLAAILESIKNRSRAGEQLGGAEHSADLFGDACNNLLLLGLAVTDGDPVRGLNR